MENDLKLQSSFRSLVSNLRDWFSVELSIKLFGVEVFYFDWPPKKDTVNHQNL